MRTTSRTPKAQKLLSSAVSWEGCRQISWHHYMCIYLHVLLFSFYFKKTLHGKFKINFNLPTCMLLSLWRLQLKKEASCHLEHLYQHHQPPENLPTKEYEGLNPSPTQKFSIPSMVRLWYFLVLYNNLMIRSNILLQYKGVQN